MEGKGGHDGEGNGECEGEAVGGKPVLLTGINLQSACTRAGSDQGRLWGPWEERARSRRALCLYLSGIGEWHGRMSLGKSCIGGR